MKKILKTFHRLSKSVAQNMLERPLAPAKEIPVLTIGMSNENRPILSYKIGHGPHKVIFVSAIHGNETGTVTLGYRLINHFYVNREKYKDFSLFIVPCLNPDGYAQAKKHPDYLHFGRIGRFNANKVDLNRNYANASFQSQAIWTRGKDYSERIPVFAGNKGNSEPETQVLTNFILKENISLWIAFHSVGKDVMGNHNSLAQELATLFSKVSGFDLMTEAKWKELQQTGTPKEWCDEHALAYLEIEASTRYGSDWKNQKTALEAVLNHISQS